MTMYEFRYRLRHKELEEGLPIPTIRKMYIERVLMNYQAATKALMEAKRIEAPFYWEEILHKIVD